MTGAAPVRTLGEGETILSDGLTLTGIGFVTRSLCIRECVVFIFGLQLVTYLICGLARDWGLRALVPVRCLLMFALLDSVGSIDPSAFPLLGFVKIDVEVEIAAILAALERPFEWGRGDNVGGETRRPTWDGSIVLLHATSGVSIELDMFSPVPILASLVKSLTKDVEGLAFEIP